MGLFRSSNVSPTWKYGPDNTYQSEPASSSLSDLYGHPIPPVYGLVTSLGCCGKYCSMGPIMSQLFLHRPALLQECNLVRTGASRNPGGHGYGIGQFPSGVPGSRVVRALDCSSPASGNPPQRSEQRNHGSRLLHQCL